MTWKTLPQFLLVRVGQAELRTERALDRLEGIAGAEEYPKPDAIDEVIQELRGGSTVDPVFRVCERHPDGYYIVAPGFANGPVGLAEGLARLTQAVERVDAERRST